MAQLASARALGARGPGFESRLSDSMNLRNTIQQDIITALKTKDQEKLEALRYLNSFIKYQEIEDKKELNNDQVLKIITSQIKKLEESLSLFEKGQRQDLIDKTRKEIEILKIYLPKQMADQDLEKEIKKIIEENKNITNTGALIGIGVKKLAGKADNQKIAQAVLKQFKK